MKSNQKGQVLVLVLLSLSVVLTLVLYILSRSVTDISVSSGQEAAVRAFSAAEAGIEKALVIGAGSDSTAVGDASYSTSVAEFAVGTYDFAFPSLIYSGDTMTTWFISHDANNNLICDGSHPCFTGNQMKVCWGNAGTATGNTTTPAIEVTVYYENTPGDVATTRLARITADPNAGRTATNFFGAPDAGTCTIAGQTYQFAKTFTFASLGIPAGVYGVTNGLVMAKTRMLYNTDTPHIIATTVNFGGNSTLPSQGQNIDSVGVAAGSNRRVVVFQGYSESPFYSNSLVSPSGITQ